MPDFQYFSMILVLTGAERPSVISLRLADPEPALVGDRIRAVVASMPAELSAGAVISVDEKAIRYRLLPINKIA